MKLISLKYNNTFVKIVSLMVVVSVIPIFALGFFFNRVGEDSIRESVSIGLQNISRRAAKETRMYISSVENILKTSSEVIANFYTDAWSSKLILRELVQDIEGVESVSYIGKEGKEVITSGIEISEKDYSKEEFFQNAIKGNVFYSKVYVSSTLMPMIKISMPVKKLKENIGVLVAEISVRYLWDLVDNIKIGKTGHAYIVDSSGAVIAHPQRDLILKHANLQRVSIIGKLLNGVVSTNEYVDETGVNVLGAAVVVPDLGWGVVVEQSIEEAFSLVSEIKKLTVGLMILTILFAVTMGLLWAAKIVSPIKQLTQGVRRVSQGDLSHSIEVLSADEIGELAENFNKMTLSLKNTQERLIQSEQLAILGRMASRIAHEVRNPLEAIKGSAVYLKNKFTEELLIQKFSKIVIQEVDQLNDFVSDVLSFSKKIELKPILTNINDILEDIYQLVSEDSRFKNIKITKDFYENVPACLFDPEHLRRAFLNIVINAMQAMPKGGEILISTRYVANPNYYIKVSIQDNGLGIPDEIKENVFKPFVTTKGSGTGLGLSYFYEIINQHRGKVKVVSEMEKGTTFMVYLPVKRKVE